MKSKLTDNRDNLFFSVYFISLKSKITTYNGDNLFFSVYFISLKSKITTYIGDNLFFLAYFISFKTKMTTYNTSACDFLVYFIFLKSKITERQPVTQTSFGLLFHFLLVYFYISYKFRMTNSTKNGRYSSHMSWIFTYRTNFECPIALKTGGTYSSHKSWIFFF